MSQIKRGAILNYLSIIIVNVVGLFMTPLIVSKLGNAEYGVYMAIGALVGTISVLDFGLSQTIVRFVAKYKAENDRKAEENFLATLMIIYSFLSFIVVIIGIYFYTKIEVYFGKMNASEIEIAKTIFLIMIFNLAIGLPGAAFNGICLGYEMFVFPKTINIVRYLLRVVLIIFLLLFGGKSIEIVILDTVLNILIIIATMYFVFKKLNVRFKLHSFDFKYIKQIFNYSIWIFVYVLVAQFQWKIGHIILGNIITPEILAIYAIGLMLGGYYGVFSTAITSVFLPRAVQMNVSNSSKEELTDFMIKIGRISFILLLYVLGGFILFGKQFILLWLGSFYNDAWIIALMIMIVYTIPLTQSFTSAIIEAENRVAFKSLTYFIFMGLGTIVGYFLAKIYGIFGMISGSVLGWIIAQNIMNIYYYKVLKLNLIRFFNELLSKTFFILILIISLAYFLNFIPGEGWVNFIIKCLGYSVIFWVLMYLFGMIKYEKDLIKTSLVLFKKRKEI